MKIVFLGTPEFAVGSLKALLEAGHKIAGVVTSPDRPSGRGRKLTPSAVKEFALKNGLKVLTPQNLKAPEFISELRSLGAELQIVVAFRMLPEVVWNMPVLGTYNLHASLLPRYRGAAPINRAIMNGDSITGVTTFKLKHEIDTGNILLQEEVPLNDEITAGELHDILMVKGASVLVKSVKLIAESKAQGSEPPFIKQREDSVTHAPKIFRDDCEIRWHNSARTVHNQVRGLSPVPGAFSWLQQETKERVQVKFFRTRVSEEKREAVVGAVHTDGSDFLFVRCGEGWVEVLELQVEGRKRMGIKELLRGFEINTRSRFVSGEH
jgi:methionyl-tRNA formyltransferase